MVSWLRWVALPVTLASTLGCRSGGVTSRGRYVSILFAVPVATFGAAVEKDLCEALRLAMQDAARAGLAFYSLGTPTGQVVDSSPEGVEARRMVATKAFLFAREQLDLVDASSDGFSLCISDESSDPDSIAFAYGAAAKMSRAAIRLATIPLEDRRACFHASKPLGDVDIFDPNMRWMDLILSGWPVFPLLAFLEHDLCRGREHHLATQRLNRGWDLREGCSGEEEEFHRVANLYVGEGLTFRFQDLRLFFRSFIEGDEAAATGPKLVLDLLFGEPRNRWTCPIALSVAYAGLADALQCYWHRSASQHMREIIEAAVSRSQDLAIGAFVLDGSSTDSPNRLNSSTGSSLVSDAPLGTLVWSRWPLLQVLARLNLRPPPFSPLSDSQVESPQPVAPAVVSWSSREAELGGYNWAERFAYEVFGGRAGIELRVDVECADVFIFRSKVPVNFGGVLVFVDGETCPEDSNMKYLLSKYPASIVLGPISPGGYSKFFPVTYASTSFAQRNHTPASLLSRRTFNEWPDERRFAAYLAFNCDPLRDHFFYLLDAAAGESGLGGVDALSRCPAGRGQAERRPARYGRSYMDDAVELFSGYRFALVFENRIKPRYVTEKIVNAFLAGAVPIYYGSPFVCRLFNPAAFIHVNAFQSFEAAIARVLEIAKDQDLYSAYSAIAQAAPLLQNLSDTRWHFSWHKSMQEQDLGRLSLRDEIAAEALEMYQKGVSGFFPAIERRVWDYVDLFEPRDEQAV